MSATDKKTVEKHGAPHLAEDIAVLMVNLGTPERADRRAVRRYLSEFLSDPRVIEAPRLLPRLLLLLLLRFLILPLRAGRSAALYRRIWQTDGSPLLVLSQRLAATLAARLAARRVRVTLAMRYGRPAIGETLDTLLAGNVQRLLVLPLYPQYSATTTASVFDAVAAHLRRHRRLPEIRFINDYSADPDWLAALAAGIGEYRARHGAAERLLFSFHGIPRRYSLAGDPYDERCQASARRIAERANLPPGSWQVTFQSRFGRGAWLTPATDATLRQLAADGIGHVQVVCPGFAVDCLETLEEIAIQGREAFMAAGGRRFDYIPALNDTPAHAAALSALILRHLGGWPGEAAADGAGTGRQETTACSGAR